MNDAYELTAADAHYLLKLYRHDGRDPAEIRWETGLSETQPPFDDDLYALSANLAHQLDEPVEQLLAVDRAEENLLRDLATAVRNNLAQYANAASATATSPWTLSC